MTLIKISTINSEIIVCIYYCDFNFYDFDKILFNSYITFQSASLNYCVYNSVAFFAIIKTSE